MIIIDYKDTRPIYEQIVEKFKTLILKGVLQADEQMPSVRNLAMDLSINPNTIQKAYAELERQGFIYAVKGRGNFVSRNDMLLERRKEACRAAIMEKVREAVEYGIEPEEIIGMVRDMMPECEYVKQSVSVRVADIDKDQYGQAWRNDVHDSDGNGKDGLAGKDVKQDKGGES